MSSPRKFSEKIALLQQKQAEDDAAFHTIIHEVEAAKQIADRGPSAAAKLDVPTRKYPTLNGINHSDNNNQYTPQTIKLEHSNGSDRLLLPPENPSWRRTHSDSSLHQAMMPTVVAQYQAQIDNQDNNQQLDFDIRDVKPEPHAYSTTTHQQYHPHPMQSHAYYDVNNNNNYPHDQSNLFYSTAQQHQQPTAPSPGNHHTHALLGTRFSGGNMNSNVLMLPPNQHPRSGGSLPDLRNGNVYHNHHQPISFAAMPPSPQQYLRSPSPHQNGDGDLYALGPQQQLPSRSGPLKLSPSIRRRHSPIGDGKTSPRRQNSPTRDGSSMPSQNHYRVDTNSPPSLPSYSPQNSPHLLASPATELSPFSPQQQQQQQQQTSADNPQHYFTLPNQFDQITLDNKFYTQQQPSPPSVPQNHSLPTTPGATNNLGSRDYYPAFMDDMTSPFCHTPTSGNLSTNVNQKSPTIPNIILTDVDSSKSDLSKELANDFVIAFDSLIDANSLQLNPDDFLLHETDLPDGSNFCDDAFAIDS